MKVVDSQPSGRMRSVLAVVVLVIVCGAVWFSQQRAAEEEPARMIDIEPAMSSATVVEPSQASSTANTPQQLGRAPATLSAELEVLPPAAPHPHRLRVVCEDENGLPVPGSFVVAREPGAGEQLTSGLADAHGSVTFELPAELDRVVLRAELDELSSGDRTVFLERNVDFELRDAEQEPLVHLVLHTFVTVRGRVVTEAGTPVFGAEARARVRGIVIGGAANAPSGPVLTDAAGAFELRLDGVPGRVAVEASLGELAAKAVTVVLPGGAAEWIELVLQESHYEISGVVRAPTGCDAAGATVRLLALEEGRSGQSTETDLNGAFLFVLEAPGEFRLAAHSHVCAGLASVAVDVDAQRPRAQIDLDFGPPSSIAGRIVQPTGEPWPGITVAAVLEACDDANAWMAEPGFRSLSFSMTTTDARGAFRLAALHPSCTYEILCIPDPARPDCRVQEASIPAGTEDLVIVVDEARIRGGVLVVEAVRGALRDPVDSISIDMMYERKPGEDWGGRSRMATYVDGVFRLEGLVIGNEYFVEARTRDAAALTIGPWIAGAEEHRV